MNGNRADTVCADRLPLIGNINLCSLRDAEGEAASGLSVLNKGVIGVFRMSDACRAQKCQIRKDLSAVQNLHIGDLRGRLNCDREFHAGRSIVQRDLCIRQCQRTVRFDRITHNRDCRIIGQCCRNDHARAVKFLPGDLIRCGGRRRDIQRFHRYRIRIPRSAFLCNAEGQDIFPCHFSCARSGPKSKSSGSLLQRDGKSALKKARISFRATRGVADTWAVFGSIHNRVQSKRRILLCRFFEHYGDFTCSIAI